MSIITQTNPVDLPPNIGSPRPQSEDIPWVSRFLTSPLVDPHLAPNLDFQIIETSTAQHWHDTRGVDPSASAPIEAFHRHPPPSAVQTLTSLKASHNLRTSGGIRTGRSYDSLMGHGINECS